MYPTRRRAPALPALLTLLVLLLAGCRAQWILVPQDWERFDPPDWYAQVHQEMVECTGLRWLQFEALEFYRSSTIVLKIDEWRAYGGVWVRPYVIVLDWDNTSNRRTVAHEIVHALSQSGHPSVDALMQECGVL